MFVSCTSLQKVYENLSKIVALTALFSLASAKVQQRFVLAKGLEEKFIEKLVFAKIRAERMGICEVRVAKYTLTLL